MGNCHTPHSIALRRAEAKRWKAERRAEGWKEIYVLLSPEAIATLYKTMSESGETKSDVIRRLLTGLAETGDREKRD